MFQSFGWYATFKKLAKNNIFKIKEVAKLNIHEVLYFLACDITETNAKIAIMNKPKNGQFTQL